MLCFPIRDPALHMLWSERLQVVHGWTEVLQFSRIEDW